MQKNALRTSMLSKRTALTQKECMKLDDLLLIQFQRLNWSNTFNIGSFLPMAKNNEPNSLLLTKYLNMIIPNLIISYPRISEHGDLMEFYEQTDHLIENKWGIMEPAPLIKVLPNQIDTILVPLLGFDLQGHRVGFGKGFYDKYLINCPDHINKIGISYFEPIVKIEDTQQFDVPLTQCITPWNIYEF